MDPDALERLREALHAGESDPRWPFVELRVNVLDLEAALAEIDRPRKKPRAKKMGKGRSRIRLGAAFEELQQRSPAPKSGALAGATRKVTG